MPPWNDRSEAMLMILADDLLRHRHSGEGLAQKERRLQIGIHDRVPVLLGELDCIGTADDPGIVDQNIQTRADSAGPRDDSARTASIAERSASSG
jgi:hypothetical protein